MIFFRTEVLGPGQQPIAVRLFLRSGSRKALKSTPERLRRSSRHSSSCSSAAQRQTT